MNNLSSSKLLDAASVASSKNAKSAAKAFSIGGTDPCATWTPPTDFRFQPSPIIAPHHASSGHTVGASLDTKVAAKRKTRTAWTSQEDEVLLKLLGGHGMEEHFPNNFKWAELAKEMNTGRNGKQCRDRWQNYLRPGIKKGEWTRDEEELIKDMHRTFGPKWCAMAKLFKNRSDNDIKNKWYSMARKSKRIREQLFHEMLPVSASSATRGYVYAPAVEPSFSAGESKPSPYQLGSTSPSQPPLKADLKPSPLISAAQHFASV